MRFLLLAISQVSSTKRPFVDHCRPRRGLCGGSLSATKGPLWGISASYKGAPSGGSMGCTARIRVDGPGKQRPRPLSGHTGKQSKSSEPYHTVSGLVH